MVEIMSMPVVELRFNFQGGTEGYISFSIGVRQRRNEMGLTSWVKVQSQTGWRPGEGAQPLVGGTSLKLFTLVFTHPVNL